MYFTFQAKFAKSLHLPAGGQTVLPIFQQTEAKSQGNHSNAITKADAITLCWPWFDLARVGLPCGNDEKLGSSWLKK